MKRRLHQFTAHFPTASCTASPTIDAAGGSRRRGAAVVAAPRPERSLRPARE